MADEDDDGIATGGGTADPAALHVALDPVNSTSQEARDYLKKQSRLADLQIENLQKLDAFETSHLRWRRFNDQMKGALQIMVVALGALIVVGIGAALWNASQADGLVVDSFTAPPGLAAEGIGGDVLATDLTNHLAAIRSFAVGNSLSNSSSVSKNDASAIKVEIPETGVSLGEAWRYLRAWLGHEDHVSGSLRELPDGNIALRAEFDGGDVIAVSGKESDLDALEQKLAEAIYARFDPGNYVVYLWNKGRFAEAYARAGQIGPRPEAGFTEADVYSLWASVTRSIAGDVPLSLARAKIAVALDPKLAVAFNEIRGDEKLLGHDEASLAAARAAAAQAESDQPKPLQGDGYYAVQGWTRAWAAKLLGDFDAAERAACRDSCLPDHLDDAALYAALRHDAFASHALLAQARTTRTLSALTVNEASYYQAREAGDWRQAVALAASRPKLYADPGMGGTIVALYDATQARPLEVAALIMGGDTTNAERIIAPTPLDCDACVDARGNIEAARKNWSGAAHWFDAASKLAPSLPFIDLDWARMLMAKGDLDGAIAKLARANQKGPHFADPLELWGEALMRKNRSDLVLKKFQEANQFAPNWGRLHLKWGEALLWTGDRDGAQKQFALARRLDLTPAEAATLLQVSGGSHG